MRSGPPAVLAVPLLALVCLFFCLPEKIQFPLFLLRLVCGCYTLLFGSQHHFCSLPGLAEHDEPPYIGIVNMLRDAQAWPQSLSTWLSLVPIMFFLLVLDVLWGLILNALTARRRVQ